MIDCLLEFLVVHGIKARRAIPHYEGCAAEFSELLSTRGSQTRHPKDDFERRIIRSPDPTNSSMR